MATCRETLGKCKATHGSAFPRVIILDDQSGIGGSNTAAMFRAMSAASLYMCVPPHKQVRCATLFF